MFEKAFELAVQTEVKKIEEKLAQEKMLEIESLSLELKTKIITLKNEVDQIQERNEKLTFENHALKVTISELCGRLGKWVSGASQKQWQEDERLTKIINEVQRQNLLSENQNSEIEPSNVPFVEKPF